MSLRTGALLAIAAGLALALPGVGARADLDPFAQYHDNVARAVIENNAAKVRGLLGGGGSPNDTDDEGHAGLHIAAGNGNIQIVALLIKARAKLDVRDKLGNTPLHYAADLDHVEIVDLLIDVGAPIDAQNKNGVTPLMMAASRGNIAVIRKLLEKGANIAKTDFTGRDALGWAADNRRPAVIQALRAGAAKR